jgi:hypothetical protein
MEINIFKNMENKLNLKDFNWINKPTKFELSDNDLT